MHPAPETEDSKLVAFCCERSGMIAWQQARHDGGLPAQMKVISVPCAGRIGTLQLLKAFEEGAEAVMVFACVKDSCQSLRGNLHAEKRTEATRALLKSVGLEPDRLGFCFIAPPMGTEFGEAVQAMMDKVALEEGSG